MMLNLDEYKPNQIITSMTKRAFMDLWEDIQSGEALARWGNGKVAETRKERTEDLRIRTICMILTDHKETLQWLLDSEWREMEVYMGEDSILHFRVMESGAQKLAKIKKLRHQYYGR